MSDLTIIMVGFIGGAIITTLIIYVVVAMLKERKTNTQIAERLRGMKAELNRKTEL